MDLCHRLALLGLLVCVACSPDASERVGTVQQAVETWEEQQNLTMPEPTRAALYGHDVALDGDVLAVGAPGTGTNGGAVDVFERTAGSWERIATLTANSGVGSPLLGRSVAIAGGRIFAGAPGDDAAAGAVFVFERAGNTWSETAKVVAATPEVGARFGEAIAVQGDLMVVGSPNRMRGMLPNVGAAFIFRDSGSWTEEAMFQPTVSNMAVIGSAVSIDDGTVIVGGNNQVYVLLESDAWSNPTPLMYTGGFFHWGLSVDLDGTRLAVGAPGGDVIAPGNSIGRVYFYELDGGQYVEQQVVAAVDSAVPDLFGLSVDLSGGSVAIGTPYKSKGLVYRTGGAHVFTFGLPLGDPCSDATECNSGFCADGMCCESDCGACQLCEGLGICKLVTAGEDPADDCEEQTQDSCGTTGECSGEGACALYPDGSTCGSGVCTAGKCRPDCLDDDTLVTVDGQGADVETPCAPYRCRDGGCLSSCSSSADCAAGMVCNIGDRTCVTAQPAVADHSGCAVSRSRRDGMGAWALLGVALALWRRRR